MTKKTPLRLQEKALGSRLSSLDAVWLSQGIPLKWRPSKSFKEIYGSVLDEHGRELLFNDITIWYMGKYGSDAMQWDGIIGRIPIELRGVLYFVRVPFVSETTLVRLTDRIENISKETADSLTPEEFDFHGRRVSAATSSWQAIYTLSVDDTFLPSADQELLLRATFDLEASCAVLSANSDTQNAIFNAHAGAEKYLKVAFRLANSSVDVKNYGHRSRDLFDQLILVAPRYSWLIKQVELLQTKLGPRMGIRYENVSRSVEDAISAIHASLFLCGSLAQIWTSDHLRGTKNSSFKASRFYMSGTRTFYCTAVKEGNATLLSFEKSKILGRTMMEFSVPTSVSCVYVEVTDTLRDDQLRLELSDHLRNRGPLLSPDEAGIKHTNSAEGIYTTAMIKRHVWYSRKLA